ncbi:HAD hydrolase-like protein [Sphingobacterium oryzagri]|uniref:HAD hydrolase-like protein n=1 Tax=Sphingobacterium oryzagri TaxID=3025669 RepID=A0ABY7WCS2_9SPHI|nr:HAD hydrolase-like protein [Sphingobacterium sp. KACC 22765]WDF67456.1 HAD hydrolase-like protein [Sphingobacterium sp. KACC 22765]
MNTTEKKHEIKMVVCDMAGTTVEENNLVYKTLKKAINHFGYAVSLDVVLEKGAGKEKKQAIDAILRSLGKELPEADLQEIFDFFLGELESAYQKAVVTPQNDANLFFKTLRESNIFIVLNTGYDKKTAETLIDRLDWKIGRDIDALITADDVPRNRPYPDMIQRAMDLLAIDSSLSVMKVGDSQIDIAEGQNAGCGLSIGITTGAHTAAQLREANPDYIVDNLLDILPLIN